MNTREAPRAFELARRRHLIEATIEALADVGFKAASLSQIARRADVSPGLFAHYFGDKDGLLEATLRFMAARLARATTRRLRAARSARERLYAVADSALADEEFDRRTSAVWLAFWGQITHTARYQRIQSIYQRRMLSNLRDALRDVVPADRVHISAKMIAALIDGVWIRSHASPSETDAATARATVHALIDGLIAGGGVASPRPCDADALAVRLLDARLPGTELRPKSPATSEPLGTFKAARRRDIDAAVEAARQGVSHWRGMSGAERARILRRCATGVRYAADELARLDALCTGRAVSPTRQFFVRDAIAAFRAGAEIAQAPANSRDDLGGGLFAYRQRDPLGIILARGGATTPLRDLGRQAAPALALGNAMVFQPVAQAARGALRLQAIMAAAGLPDGVFATIVGDAETTRALVDHPCLASVQDVGRDGAVPMPKAATIVFADADIAATATVVLRGCARWTETPDLSENRIFVQAAIASAFRRELIAQAAAIRWGDPFDPATEGGTLASTPHGDGARAAIDAAVAQGAQIAAISAYAIVAGCRDDMDLVRVNFFAPVVTLLEFDDAEDLIPRLRGDRLAVGLFSADLDLAHRIARTIRAELCCINDGALLSDARAMTPDAHRAEEVIRRYSHQTCVFSNEGGSPRRLTCSRQRSLAPDLSTSGCA